MKKRYEEKEGAKERFDRAMSTIFQAPKAGAKAEQAVKKKKSFAEIHIRLRAGLMLALEPQHRLIFSRVGVFCAKSIDPLLFV